MDALDAEPEPVSARAVAEVTTAETTTDIEHQLADAVSEAKA